MFDSFYFSDFMFTFVPVFIGIIFVIVFGSILVSVIKGIRTYRKNENAPKLTVPAVIVSKRTDLSRRSGGTEHHSHTRTNYFVTFEFESGDRSEFKVSGEQYGLLVEEDEGTLTFQGSRYGGFTRSRQEQLGG
ncbi:DUF2500 domain-containing protein [Halobacillus litoralis]|uniref:DUF2500 domain-containing protein n=1 Tax=Halobacillus litoralis TaxID=45668 RepID=UPI001CD53D15|nr:DUF2500 domain-containing protein [Halobacillus litoralis]MCA0969327.1 DUF2500 domain-containing protein [Halobacillus litoralis]